MTKETFVKYMMAQTSNGHPMPREVAEEMWEAVHMNHCLLCGGEQVFIGIWDPENSVAYGGKSDKQRKFFYGLCKAHKPSAEITTLVEAKIFELTSPYQTPDQTVH